MLYNSNIVEFQESLRGKMDHKRESRVYQIMDIINWKNNFELVISPKYQRNSVWDEKAKSYLVDSIIRGYPVPPLFMKQTIDLASRRSIREVIDGQQRITTILEFYNDGFSIKQNHNSVFGGLKYSELPDDIKEKFLNYNIFVDFITAKEDEIIYDIFARLNTNVAALNHQEIRNAKFWGDFKVLAYDLAKQYKSYFVEKGTFTDKSLSRMADVEYISVLLMISLEGSLAESKDLLDKAYKKYDSCDDINENFKQSIIATFNFVDSILSNLEKSNFFLKQYMLDLLILIYSYNFKKSILDLDRDTEFELFNLSSEHRLYNIKHIANRLISMDNIMDNIMNKKYAKVHHLDGVGSILFSKISEYVEDHKTHSTNQKQRLKRIVFLKDWILENEFR
jgi:hypothetical protein